MKIGVAREIKPDEYRVALTPAGARELVQKGHDVLIETGAGDGSSFADAPSFLGDDASKPTGPNDASLYNDGGLPDVGGDGACLSADAGAPPYPQRCAPATANECDGTTDTWLASNGVSASSTRCCSCC